MKVLNLRSHKYNDQAMQIFFVTRFQIRECLFHKCIESSTSTKQSFTFSALSVVSLLLCRSVSILSSFVLLLILTITHLASASGLTILMITIQNENKNKLVMQLELLLLFGELKGIIASDQIRMPSPSKLILITYY